ncbi:MAG: D-tyrosyl-tRNA(Tyr) deacylase [Acholeplasmatales bacterium]|nr:MAG: D-tyrosyl-tRNA(Tyr) deacylase [Acholeplasmatales bacterium]
MQVLVQRVKEASCEVDGRPISAIAQGFVLFVSFHQTDTAALIPVMAKKVARLRIFSDAAGKMNRSLIDDHLEALSISQFTLEANTDKGHRPSFTEALDPDTAETFYLLFNEALENEGVLVKTGQFGAAMQVKLVNDGPVTLLLKRTHPS